MGIFTPKAGGTFFGNALRKIGNSVSPLLGNGGAMITQEQEDHRDLTDDLYIQKYGKDKSGQVVEGVIPNPSINSRGREYDSLGKTKAQRFWATVWGWTKRNWYWLAIPIVLVIIWKIGKRLFSNKRSYRKRW